MTYEIILSPEAVSDLHRLKANERSAVRDSIENYLRHNPTQLSKSQIERLRGLSRPQYRLRVEDIRVFYDVNENIVEILVIVEKAEAQPWLEESGQDQVEKRGEKDEKSGIV